MLVTTECAALDKVLGIGAYTQSTHTVDWSEPCWTALPEPEQVQHECDPCVDLS